MDRKRGRAICKNKKGDAMSMPFTVIFSIIMVAIVIFVGFYVINMFLERAEQVKLNKLPMDIEEAVINAWQSSETEQQVSLDSSTKIQQICFADFSLPAKGTFAGKYSELKSFDSSSNFFYYPLMKSEKYHVSSHWQIKCGDKDCLTVQAATNPLCITVENGKVSFTLVKEAGQAYVLVKK